MANYKSTHTGEQIDNAITKVENGDLPIASATTLGGVKIGDGISVTDDGTISASGGSSGGGTKLYKHTIPFWFGGYGLHTLTIISTRATPYTSSDDIITSFYTDYFYCYADTKKSATVPN